MPYCQPNWTLTKGLLFGNGRPEGALKDLLFGYLGGQGLVRRSKYPIFEVSDPNPKTSNIEYLDRTFCALWTP